MGFNFCLIFPKLSASKRRRLNLERETKPCKSVSPLQQRFFCGGFSPFCFSCWCQLSHLRWSSIISYGFVNSRNSIDQEEKV